MPEGVLVEEKPKIESREGKTVYIQIQEKPPRDFQIPLDVIKDNRPTVGCAGCWSKWNGRAFQLRNAACRERFREIMKDTARVKNAARRMEEFENRIKRQRQEGQASQSGSQSGATHWGGRTHGGESECGENRDQHQQKRKAEEEIQREGEDTQASEPAGGSGSSSSRGETSSGSSSSRGETAAESKRKREEREEEGKMSTLSEEKANEGMSKEDREPRRIFNARGPRKRKGEQLEELEGEGGRARIEATKSEIIIGGGAVESVVMLAEIGKWVQEVRDSMITQELAWDDVNNIPLAVEGVSAARREEADFMLKRGRMF